MKLSLMDLNNGSVFIGNKLNVRASFTFEEDTSLLWSGISLITNPPCKKELHIAKKEIFSSGFFEAGQYVRERAIFIKNNVVPTIKNRDLKFFLQLIFRKENPINPEDDLIIKRTQDIEIKTKDSKNQPRKLNPISFSISGLNINLPKDVFKPGETLKINYSSENLIKIEVRLLQKANLICFCEPYGKNCQNVEDLPPAIAGASKTTNTDEGFMLLKIPEIAEPSHNYLWEPSEKEHWGMKYGDYCRWSLLIIGKKKPEYGSDKIEFEVPITIAAKPIKEEREGMDLFAGEDTNAPSLFENIPSKFKKRFQMISIDSHVEENASIRRYKIRLKNISNKALKGITIKLSGLQEGLFETGALLRGFNSWEKDELKEITYKTKQNISAIISIIEDNSHERVRIQTPISF